MIFISLLLFFIGCVMKDNMDKLLFWLLALAAFFAAAGTS
jgi:hypothetical protein